MQLFFGRQLESERTNMNAKSNALVHYTIPNVVVHSTEPHMPGREKNTAPLPNAETEAFVVKPYRASPLPPVVFMKHLLGFVLLDNLEVT